MTSMAVKQNDPRPGLKAQLCREPFRIPNLKTFYKDWPQDVNPSYPQLKVALEARIDRYACQYHYSTPI
jgi:hypothetical protein